MYFSTNSAPKYCHGVLSTAKRFVCSECFEDVRLSIPHKLRHTDHMKIHTQHTPDWQLMHLCIFKLRYLFKENVFGLY